MKIILFLTVFSFNSFAGFFIAKSSDGSFFVAKRTGWIGTDVIKEVLRENADIDFYDIVDDVATLNESKKTAKIALKNQQAQDEANAKSEALLKEQKINILKSAAVNALRNWDTLTTNQKDLILKNLLKQFVKREVQSSEL